MVDFTQYEEKAPPHRQDHFVFYDDSSIRLPDALDSPVAKLSLSVEGSAETL